MKVAVATLTALLAWIVGWELATLTAAHELGTRAAAPDFAAFGIDLYWPWQWLVWLEELPARGDMPGNAELVGSATVLACAGLVIAVRLRTSKPKTTSDAYGSAHWSTDDEIRRAGLGDEGVVLCQTADAKYKESARNGRIEWQQKRSGDLLCDAGPGHVLCFAPTRSGKGVGLVIPTLLSWRHSVLVYDMKKELWHITAGWRRQFSYCWRFEPSSPTSLHYNPLFEVPRGDGDVRQAQNIADILIDPDGTQERRDHWQKTACDLLVGAILHVLYAGPRPSLAGVLELLSDPARDHEQILKVMMETKHLGDRPHPQVVVSARGVLNKHPNERSGVFSTALSCLGIYLDPVIARNTDDSHFLAEQLNSLDRPVSLYLVVPPSDSDRLRPLIRLILNQVGKRLTESMEQAPSDPPRPSLLQRLRNAAHPPTANEAPAQKKRHKLLYLIDEFPTLGRLPFIESAMAFAAGYGIKFFLVAQSLNQLEKVYGANHSFLDNSAVRIAYAANDERTAQRISNMLGQRTEVQPRQTRSKRKSSIFFDQVSEADSEHARALLTPGEVLTLPFDQALVLVNGASPYLAKKVMYYQDERFTGRPGLPTPESSEEQRAELPAVPPSPWLAVATATPAAAHAQPTASVPATDPQHAPSSPAEGDGERVCTANADADANTSFAATDALAEDEWTSNGEWTEEIAL